MAFLTAGSASAQVMQFFGDWISPGVEYYVSTTGLTTNPGTLAQPVPSIALALARATTNGDLGVRPVTINVMGGTYGTGGVPIALPAHGVSVEAYSLGAAGVRPVIDAAGAATDTFLFNTIGTPGLPDSVLRGLDIRNSSQAANSTEVRIQITTAPAAAQRVAPEIRDCIISGSSDFGVHIASTANVNLDPVIERNVIFSTQSKLAASLVGVQVTGGAAPTSPVIRSNQIRNFPTNVLFLNGGLNNQPRLQSNFIQVGSTNVRCDNCAPYIVGNTIAFAFSTTAVPVGIEWTNTVTTMTLANNLIWNPPQGGSTPVEILGNLGIFLPVNVQRTAWFNYDGADTLVTWGMLPNFGPSSGIPNPDFVGGNGGAGLAATDLHLNPTSFLRELGVTLESAPGAAGFPPVAIPGAPAAIVVRRDHAHDVDFDARITGFNCEIGADEVTDLMGAAGSSPTRGASMRYRVGSVSGTDFDILGNMVPTAGGTWSSDVEIVGTPGDLVMLLSGVGYFDVITDPAFPGVFIENTSVFQNVLGSGALLPGMVTLASLGLDIFGGSVTVGFAVIPAGGVLPMTINFGAFNPAFRDGEGHLQAVVLDPTLTLVQTTNRLPMDLNE